MTKSERVSAMVIIAIILSLIVAVLYVPQEKPPLIDTAHEGPYLVKLGNEYLGWTQTIKEGSLRRGVKKGWTADLAFAWQYSVVESAAVDASDHGGTVVIMRDEVRARERYLARR